MRLVNTITITLVWVSTLLRAANYPAVEISNAQISAKLYLPDTKRGYYRGTRFDWSGVIYNLQFQGHNYYGPWYQKTDASIRDFIHEGPDIVAGTCSAITGPVEEFLTNGKALGYDEAKPGGTFLKIGVGSLRKPDSGDYDRFRMYEIVDPGKWTVSRKAESVEFVQRIRGPAGYSYLYRKIVRLSKDKPEMVLEHSLKNTGRRTIATSVYDHNFLVLDQRPPGPGYSITFPFEVKSYRPPPPDFAKIRGTQIIYLKTLENKDRVSMDVEGFSNSSKDYDIRIQSSKIGAGLRIIGDHPLTRELLWSIRSVVAIEPYIDISVNPGDEVTWKYTYDFYTVQRPIPLVSSPQ